jgi:hypothetical protein
LDASKLEREKGNLQHTNYETGNIHTELRLISCKKRAEAFGLKQTVAANRQLKHNAVTGIVQ